MVRACGIHFRTHDVAPDNGAKQVRHSMLEVPTVVKEVELTPCRATSR